MGASSIYTLTTPFTSSDVLDLGYEQTADLMIITHPSHPPQALRRYDHNDWRIADAQFMSLTAAPTGVAAVAHSSTAGSPTDHVYVVTAVDDATGRESLPSAPSAAVNIDLGVDVKNYVSISWTGVAGCTLCNVYEALNGVYGFVGTSANLTLRDNNISPDLTDGPPGDRDPFSAADKYPGVVTFHEQRAVYGRTNLAPNTVWGSQSGDFFNMNVAVPAKASDAYQFGLVARQVNEITHLVPARVLLAFTANVVFSLTGPAGFLSNTSFKATPETYRGASKVRPCVVDDIVFYNTSKGCQIRTIGYQFSVDGYRGNDVTVFAPHLFRGHTIRAMAWAFSPTSTLYCVRDDGVCMALTWQAEQDVWGWTLLDTDGLFLDVIVVTENGEDVPYFIVQRAMNGQAVQFVERMATPVWTDYSNMCFADSATTYSGPPATHFTGLQHLNQREVVVVADGAVITGSTVAFGALVPDLKKPASNVVVGLPYEGWVHTLPSVTQAPGLGSTVARKSTVGQGYLSLIRTRGIEIAPGRLLRATDPDTSDASAAGPFYPVKFRTPDTPYGQPPDLFTGLADIELAPGDWTEATVVLRQRQPLPFTLIGIFPDVTVGG